MKCSAVTALLFVLASACNYEIPGEAPAMREYAPELTAAMAEWSTEYAEACDLSAVTVAIADGEVLAELCNEEPGMKGCHSRAPRPSRHVIAISAEYADEARNTVTHEALHICAETTGVFPDDQPAHDEAAIWDEGGILARVNAALGLPPD